MLTTPLFALATAIVATVLAAVLAFLRYVREQRHQSDTLLNALFAELANVFEHCSYASIELPINNVDKFELTKRLRWAKYGALRSADDVAKLGFLDASSVKSLLQLELLIRNDDLYLEQLLGDIEGCTEGALLVAKKRLKNRTADAARLLDTLAGAKPHLKPVLADLKKRLPPS